MPFNQQQNLLSSQKRQAGNPPVLKISNLGFAYTDKQPILRNINLSLDINEALGLMGANGSGKSTLFRCITGLETFKKGEMHFLCRSVQSREDFAYLRTRTGYVLQNSENQAVFPTVIEDVIFGPLNLGYSSGEAHQIAHEILENLGISAFAERIIMNLSGGEKKLVAIAGILAMRPTLLLLDEPLNELDSVFRERLIRVLKNLSCAKIIASHDMEIFTELGCRICKLENGELLEKASHTHMQTK